MAKHPHATGRIRALCLPAAIAACCAIAPAQAEISDNVVKIGVLTDMAGPYSDQTGRGSVIAAQMAIDEFGGKVAGMPIELISADHQNKPDIGSNITRQWIDQDGVDILVDIGSSAVALAVQNLVKEKQRMVIFSGAGTDRLTNDACSPYGIHWTYDTYATGRSIAEALMDEGQDTWFFITMDNAFGKSLEDIATRTITERGGKVLGSVKHPMGLNDFSSFILQAQGSGAKVIALLNSGLDFVQAVKQAREFGIDGATTRIVGPAVAITDIKALGPQAAGGLQYVEAFYWDLNDRSRDFTARFSEIKGAKPGQAQAGVYSAVRSYLKAIEATGSDNADTVMAQMRGMEISDAFTPAGRIREDGRMVHDMYLVQAKKPGQPMANDWDVVELSKVIDGEQAFRPLSASDCPLVAGKH